MTHTFHIFVTKSSTESFCRRFETKGMHGWEKYLKETWRPPFSSSIHVYSQIIENPKNTKGEFDLFLSCLEGLDWFIKKGHFGITVLWKEKGRRKTKGTYLEASVLTHGEWYSQRRWALVVSADQDTNHGEKTLSGKSNEIEFQIMVSLRNRTDGNSQSY